MRRIFGILCVCLSIIGSYGSPISVSNANLYIDTILNTYVAPEVKVSKLDPANLGPIEVVVTEGNMFQHTFKGNFTLTELKGLSNGVHRYGNCSAPGMVGGKIVVGCNVHFGDVKVKLEGKGHGDSVLNTEHKISAKVTFGDSYALVETTGDLANYPGVLRTLNLARLNLVIKTTDIDLTGKREKQFMKNLGKELGKRFSDLLMIYYGPALDRAVRKVNLPPV